MNDELHKLLANAREESLRLVNMGKTLLAESEADVNAAHLALRNAARFCAKSDLHERELLDKAGLKPPK